MKTTKESLTNNQIFALRMRVDRAGNRELRDTIDRYLELRGDDDLQTVLNQLNGDVDRPGVVFLRHPSGAWKTVELHIPDDVDRIRGWTVDRVVYVRGIYSQATIGWLVLIETHLKDILGVFRADGVLVEQYLDGPG